MAVLVAVAVAVVSVASVLVVVLIVGSAVDLLVDFSSMQMLADAGVNMQLNVHIVLNHDL